MVTNLADVLKRVLGIDDDHPIVYAIAGLSLDTVEEFSVLDQYDLHYMGTFTNDDGSSYPSMFTLSDYHQKLLAKARGYIFATEDRNWDLRTRDGFLTWVMDHTMSPNTGTHHITSSTTPNSSPSYVIGEAINSVASSNNMFDSISDPGSPNGTNLLVGSPTINTPVIHNLTTPAIHHVADGTLVKSKFHSGIKFQMSDYPKLTDDSKWLEYKRKLFAAASSHDTIDLLLTGYVHDDTDADQRSKTRFMYNMFSQQLQTSKGRVCVKQHEKTFYGHMVFKDLVLVYDDDLASAMASTSAREYLTLLRLDDKWKSSYESFLTHWSSKILELESLEDSVISGEQRRIWLTQALIGHDVMATAIRTAQTNEISFRRLTPEHPD